MKKKSIKIIISPAKKMNMDSDSLVVKTIPHFLEKTKILHSYLKTLEYEEIKKLWQCNDSIAQKQYEQLHTIKLTQNSTPAILAYEGIQYKYMAPHVFTAEQLEYAEEHLRIVSGFYGLLKPFDGIIPYRLEMQAKIKMEGYTSLYNFWGESLAKQLEKETEVIINLASKEYSKCFTPFLHEKTQFITCTFAERIGEKIVEKATMCKMARGEMTRFLAEEGIETTDGVKKFNRMKYTFSEKDSNKNNYVFIKGE